GTPLLLGIFTGSVASYLFNNFSIQDSFIHSLLFTALLFSIRFILLRFCGAITPLASTKVLLQFVTVTAIMTLLHVLLQNHFLGHTYWLMQWLGELNGIMCLTPLCLMFEPFTVQRYFNKRAYSWWIGSILLIAAHFLLFFLSDIYEIFWAILLLILLCY